MVRPEEWDPANVDLTRHIITLRDGPSNSIRPSGYAVGASVSRMRINLRLDRVWDQVLETDSGRNERLSARVYLLNSQREHVGERLLTLEEHQPAGPKDRQGEREFEYEDRRHRFIGYKFPRFCVSEAGQYVFGIRVYYRPPGATATRLIAMNRGRFFIVRDQPPVHYLGVQLPQQQNQEEEAAR